MKKLFYLCCCFPLFVLAQPTPAIKNLVFEGAGIRGIAYCGVLAELENNNMTAPIEKVGGTSAGAIMALTIALGYTAAEIETIIGNTNFKQFNDGKYFFGGGLNRTKKYFGWYRGKVFEQWLEEIIERKTGNVSITFAELKSKGFKDLYLTGTCLNRQQLVIFSHNTYPHMKIKDAVRISMSIPLYFEAVFIDSSGNIVQHPKNKQGLDVMVDGGFTGNYPIRIFDTTANTNCCTLGFRIDSEEQLKVDSAGKSIAAMPVNNLNQYVNAFYNMVIENLNRQQLTAEDWKRTVSISDGKIGPRIRKLSAEEKKLLMDNGRMAVSRYFIEKH